jgi:hypothetical protein
MFRGQIADAVKSQHKDAKKEDEWVNIPVT